MSQRSYTGILCNYNVQDYSILYDNHVRTVICEEGEVLVHKNSLTSQIFIEVHIPTQELFRPCSIFCFSFYCMEFTFPFARVTFSTLVVIVTECIGIRSQPQTPCWN